MDENVKNQLDQLGNIIDEKIEKATGQALESANGKADETLKGEIDNLTKKFNERFDAFEVENKKMFEKKNESKDFRTNLTKALNEGAIDNLVKGNTSAAKFEIKADMVIKALGFDPEDLPYLFDSKELQVTKWGTLKTNFDTMETNLRGVFAAGDIVRGASLVVWAIKDGRDAAEAMKTYLESNEQKKIKVA